MKKFIFPLLVFGTLTFAQKKYVMVIHGGAGTITKANLSPEKEKEYAKNLQKPFKKDMPRSKTVNLL
jgi:beta-aspartyl-peptidase (threonine type)